VAAGAAIGQTRPESDDESAGDEPHDVRFDHRRCLGRTRSAQRTPRRSGPGSSGPATPGLPRVRKPSQNPEALRMRPFSRMSHAAANERFRFINLNLLLFSRQLRPISRATRYNGCGGVSTVVTIRRQECG
jgi:hypothetical protein